jgi:hypothetical protein
VAGIGERVAAGVAQHVNVNRKGEARSPMHLMSRVTASDAPAEVVKLTVPSRAAAAASRGAAFRRWPDCRDEYIDLMAGVPQIADDFAASR